MRLHSACAFLLPHLANAFAPYPQRQSPLASTTDHLPTVDIPQLGLGTWRLDPSNASLAVSIAIQAGYEHIDAAAVYGNEKEVGKGIKHGLKTTGLSRENLWITSKLWNTKHGHENVERALDRTLVDLDLDYLDLYLMHWPVDTTGNKPQIEYLDTWLGMEALIATGKVRHIGISNFDLYELADLQVRAEIKPAVHQFETHPYLQQWDFLEWHKALGIAVTAYSPLANLNPAYDSASEKPSSGASYDSRKGDTIPPSLLENEVITKIGKKRGCTNAQVALAWGMARGTSVIPKSAHAGRIIENYESQLCVLHYGDFVAIEELGQRYSHRFNKQGKNWGVSLFDGLEDPDVRTDV